MERDGRLAAIVGGFVILAGLALAATILSLTSESGIFVEHYRLISRFENVQGLLPGAPVWLAGKEVGRVEAILFEPVGSDMPVVVRMGIDQAIQDRIRGDSIGTIGTIGVLGDSYMEISVGTAAMPMLEAGAELRSQSPVNINSAVAKGSMALDNVAELANNLNSVVLKFTEDAGVQRSGEAIGAASDIMLHLREGPGLLHNLIYDSYEGQGVESIERSLARLERILEEISEGEGIMHSLIYDKPNDQDIVAQGVKATVRLNSILEKIDAGDGTLGLLVNDPTLYDDMQSLLGGAKRSVVLRSMVRMAVENDGG
jgi:phospholipid/cholesterol/gamma-HCH transport system substrate-binding protein